MFGISGEHLLILGIVLLIFGPKRLPELGNTLGKAIRNFKDAVSGVEEAKYRKLPDQPGAPKSAPGAATVAAASGEAPHADATVVDVTTGKPVDATPIKPDPAKSGSGEPHV
jgi:sec-independent protein translocase protein TatA